ncbi:MAG: hypothetical protein QOF76_695, partial [Solirubrobacteraceae bacterium]|nr:hypothetical protein [Solirubrobacteraceae bacterium]
AGLAIGFGGVVALVGIDIAGESRELVGAGLVLLAAFGYACGPMLLMTKFGDLDPRTTMAVTLSFAALFLTPFAWAHPPVHTPPLEAFGALAVLGVLCTATAFLLFGRLIVEIGAARASVITYVAPVVAVALGVIVLGEDVGLGAVAGLLLILAGSWLSTDGRLPPGLERRLRRSAATLPDGVGTARVDARAA